MTVEVAPGVELRVARQAVLRRIDDDRPRSDDAEGLRTRPPRRRLARDVAHRTTSHRHRTRARGARARRPGARGPRVARSELMRRKTLLPLVLIFVAAYGGLLATLPAGNSPELGLDLQGGVSVVLAPTGETAATSWTRRSSISKGRVDALGVAEPEITRQGDAIVVQLPGVKNHEYAPWRWSQTPPNCASAPC